MARTVQAVLVAVLLVVNAVLILEAVQDHRNADKPSALEPAPTGTTASLPTDSPGGSNDFGPFSQAAQDVRAATPYQVPLVSAISEVEAWRANPGCETGPNLAARDPRTGAWNRMLSPNAYILRLQMTAPDEGWVVAANATCTESFVYRTKNRGDTWSEARPPGRIWFETPVGVRTPSGDLSRPCGRSRAIPLALGIATPKKAVVICHRGLFVTSNGGSTWQPTADVPKGRAVDVALTKSGHGVLMMQNQAKCSGVFTLLTTDFGSTWDAGECLKVASPPLGMSIAPDGTGLLTAVQALYTTSDYGHTWS